MSYRGMVHDSKSHKDCLNFLNELTDPEASSISDRVEGCVRSGMSIINIKKFIEGFRDAWTVDCDPYTGYHTVRGLVSIQKIYNITVHVREKIRLDVLKANGLEGEINNIIK